MWMAAQTRVKMANRVFRGLKFSRVVLAEAIAAWEAHGDRFVACCSGGQGGVPRLRGKLLEAQSSMHTILAMRFPCGGHGLCSPFSCGYTPPLTHPEADAGVTSELPEQRAASSLSDLGGRSEG